MQIFISGIHRSAFHIRLTSPYIYVERRPCDTYFTKVISHRLNVSMTTQNISDCVLYTHIESFEYFVWDFIIETLS